MKMTVETVQDGIFSVWHFTPLTSDIVLVHTEHGGHFLHISLKSNYENLWGTNEKLYSVLAS